LQLNEYECKKIEVKRLNKHNSKKKIYLKKTAQILENAEILIY
jgi:hypothetical protein